MTAKDPANATVADAFDIVVADTPASIKHSLSPGALGTTHSLNSVPFIATGTQGFANPFTGVGSGEPSFEGYDNHGIAEFNIASVPGAVSLAKLSLDLVDDYYGNHERFEVYTYVGDGAVTIADHGQGVLVASSSFTWADTRLPAFSIDLDTGVINSLLAGSGTTWLAFNVRMINDSPGFDGMAFYDRPGTTLDLWY